MPDQVFAITASDETVFAARSSGLVRSLDGGDSWNYVFARAGTDLVIPASAVALSPQFRHDRTVFAAVSGGILRSRDSGETWESAEFSGPAPFISALAVSPAFEHDRVLFAASLEDGVFRTTDGGATWASWNFGLLDFQVLSLAITAEKMLYAGTGTGLFVSQNAGRAWNEIFLFDEAAAQLNLSPVSGKNPKEHMPVLSLACSPGLLLVGTEGSGLHASRDNGRAWQCLGEDVLENINALILDGFAMLAVTLDGLILSTDNGSTWQGLPWPADNESPVAVAAPHGLHSGANLIVGGSNGSLLKIALPSIRIPG